MGDLLNGAKNIAEFRAQEISTFKRAEKAAEEELTKVRSIKERVFIGIVQNKANVERGVAAYSVQELYSKGLAHRIGEGILTKNEEK